MHELGVTFYVVRDVKKVAEENNVKKIDYVTLEISRLLELGKKKRSCDRTCKNLY